MADIKFRAFIEDWTKNNPQHPDWACKTAETHRKKDGDQWVTTSRTFRTVKAGYDNDQPVTIDFTRFTKGQQVEVVGKELTEVREHDGKKYYDLVVKATSVTLIDQDRHPRQQQAQQQQGGYQQTGMQQWAQGGADDSATPF